MGLPALGIFTGTAPHHKNGRERHDAEENAEEKNAHPIHAGKIPS
jgi:hypothetical protein